MKISVFIDSLERERALTRFFKYRIKQVLKRHGHFIERVEVRMRDINGERGGLDKECKIFVATALSSPIVITAVHSDPGQAFRVAIKRLVPNVRAKLDKSIFRERRARNIIRSHKVVA